MGRSSPRGIETVKLGNPTYHKTKKGGTHTDDGEKDDKLRESKTTHLPLWEKKEDSERSSAGDAFRYRIVKTKTPPTKKKTKNPNTEPHTPQTQKKEENKKKKRKPKQHKKHTKKTQPPPPPPPPKKKRTKTKKPTTPPHKPIKCEGWGMTAIPSRQQKDQA